MGCDSTYMASDTEEKEMSKVACLIDELSGLTYQEDWWEGYHPKVYNNCLSREDMDDMVRYLCDKSKCADSSQYSLRLQAWWLEHRAADLERKHVEKEVVLKDKKEDKDIYDLELHESLYLEKWKLTVLRVPGGWMYSEYYGSDCPASSVFIPWTPKQPRNGGVKK